MDKIKQVKNTLFKIIAIMGRDTEQSESTPMKQKARTFLKAGVGRS